MNRRRAIKLLKQGTEAWNQARAEDPDIPDLTGAKLTGRFRNADLTGADLTGAKR